MIIVSTATTETTIAWITAVTVATMFTFVSVVASGIKTRSTRLEVTFGSWCAQLDLNSSLDHSYSREQ